MAGYTRQSEASIQPGEDITAAPLNAEFDAVESAFNGSTGHTHDGTTGNGPKIPFAGLLDTIDQDDMSSNSATKIPTQQSVKAYVDNSIAAIDIPDQGVRTIRTITGATDTLVLSDVGKVITSSYIAGDTVITVPPNSSVAFPVGTQIDFLITDLDSLITWTAGTGVTILVGSVPVTSATTDYVLINAKGASLLKSATNTWTLFGGLEPDA